MRGLVTGRLLRPVAVLCAITVVASAAGVLGALGSGLVSATAASAGTPPYKAQCTGIPILTKLTLPTTVTRGRLTPTTVTTGTTVTAKTLSLGISLPKTLAGLFPGQSFGAKVTMEATVTGATPTSGTITFSESTTVPPATTIPPSGLKLTAPGTLTPPTLTAGNTGTVTLSQEASTSTHITAKITVTLAGTEQGPFNCLIPAEPIAAILPTITSSSLPTGSTLTPYSATLAATGGTTPYTWSASGLPAGLSISSTGKIAGTPTAPGSSTVKLTVTDHNAKQATKTLQLVVAVGSPKVATTSLPHGRVGTAYAVSLVGGGGKAPDTWRQTGLPPGLALTATGLVSGTPKFAGTFPVTATVTFETSQQATSTLMLDIATGAGPGPRSTGYWSAASDGGVFSYGPNARYLGSMGGRPLNAPVAGMASMPTGWGYWEVGSDGGIFSFGAATYFGSMGGRHLDAPVVGLATAPTGRGYWEVASDGGIFAFGAAKYYGSMGGQDLNAPVVGMAVTATSKGYWEVAADGGVFAFGAAKYYGSMGGRDLNVPVVGVASTPLGKGYWEVASDGGVFSFGSVRYFGSMGGQPLVAPVVGLTPTPTGKGYWEVATDGGVFSFAAATFYGSVGGRPLAAPMVGATTAPASQPAAFTAHGSYNELYVEGANPGQHLIALDGSGNQVGEGTADSYGSLIVHTLAPGPSYVVESVIDHRTFETPSFSVIGTSTAPPPTSFYADQTMHAGLNYLSMRDGVTIAATLRLPPGKTLTDGPFPTVIEYSGYPVAGPGSLIQHILHPSTPTTNPTLLPSGSTAVGSALAPLLGFAEVSLQMRGTGCSGGAFDLFNSATIHDGYDAVQIVGSQPWAANHKVGLVGISFSGISQMFVGGTEPPDLAAIAPMSTTDTLYATGFPGGMFNSGFAASWINARVSTAQPAPGGGQAWARAEIKLGTTQCLANQALREQIQTIYALLKQGQFKTSPLYQARNMAQWAKKINVPVFLSGALQDTETGPQWTNIITALSSNPTVWVTMVNGAHIDSIGPGAFTRWVEFLDLYVADEPAHITGTVQTLSSLIYSTIGNGASAETLPPLSDTGPTLAADRQQYAAQNPRVTVLFTNGGGSLGPGAFQPLWSAGFSSWPPSQAQATTFDLATGGTLVTAPAATASSVSFKPTPTARPATDLTPPGGTSFGAHPSYKWAPVTGSEGLGFVSTPLTKTTVSVGPASLDLYLKSSAADTDLQATISEVMPTGTKEMYVTSGFLRASDRALTATASTATHPVPTYGAATASPLPGTQFTLVRIPIDALGHRFPKGSRIRLTITAPGGTRPQWAFTTFKTTGQVTDSVSLGVARPSALVMSLEPTVTPPAITPAPACGSLRAEPCRTFVAAGNGG